MPPQDDKTVAVQAAAASEGSYWDAPPEKKLEGKTLSTLSLGGLERVNREEEEEEEVAPPKEGAAPMSGGYWDELQQGMKKTLSKLNLSDLRAPSRPSTTTTGDNETKEDDSTKEKMANSPSGGYWDELQQGMKKTLSKLNLSDLRASSRPSTSTAGDNETKEEDSTKEKMANSPSGGYWDELQQGMQKTLSKLNLSDLRASSRPSTTTEEIKKAEDSSMEKMTKRPSSGSFWLWRNPSLSDLNDHPEIEEATKDDTAATDKKKTNPVVMTRRPSGAGGYWFWRNPSANNLTEGQTTDNEADVEAMAKKAKESDRIEGQQGPISNMQHRFRTSWRASFHKLSTTSLTALNESETPAEEEKAGVAEGWKEDFSDKGNTATKRISGNTMTKRDSFLVQEDGEEDMVF